MRRTVIGLILTALTAAAACAPEPEATGGTDSVTQNLLSSAASSAPQAESAPPASLQARPTLDIVDLGFDRGSPDAPVRVIEMSDYGCGYCRQFHEETWPMILEEFIETAKVEWKFVAFVNGMFRNSPHATTAAECMLEQGAERFEAMNRRIWDGQSEWKGSADPEPLLRGWAAEEGADLARYDSCLAEDRRSERIRSANALSRQAGVRGTPTFFVIGYPPLQGALPPETFREVLTLVHADAVSQGPGG